MDTLGLLIAGVVLNANCSEQRGGMIVVHEAGSQAEALERIWVDQGYQGENFARVVAQLGGAQVEVLKRPEGGARFCPSPGWWSELWLAQSKSSLEQRLRAFTGGE